MILSSACCTPSPDTSRVIEGLSDLREIVDLVDVDNAALRALDVVVGGLQQLENDVLDVLADITRFGQRGRIRHRERHIEDPGERLRQQRLAGAGRSD
jgi:septum formation inhibitor-activating ATPase MinD